MLEDVVVDREVSRAIDRIPNHLNELGYDPWGLHPESAKLYYSIARRVVAYFRPEIHGIEHLPAGRVLVVANHSGQLPLDGLLISVAALLQAEPPRLLRAMAERWVPTLPWVSEILSRCGVVVGDPTNCRNLLRDENAILDFPEGTRGSGKIWRDRYRLKRFGRGFMRLALRTNTPIVPVAVIGGEESIISVHNARKLAALLRAPYFPVHPLAPLLGPLAYWPLPVKFHVWFGEPLHFSGPYDDEDAAIEEKVAVVTRIIQRMIDDGLARRRGLFR